jgi:hypothetical protein
MCENKCNRKITNTDLAVDHIHQLSWEDQIKAIERIIRKCEKQHQRDMAYGLVIHIQKAFIL